MALTETNNPLSLQVMRLYIKNMVCNRCVMVVQDILRQCGVRDATVSLGHADLPSDMSAASLLCLGERLKSVGFELIDDKRAAIVDAVKRFTQEFVNLGESAPNVNLSDFLASKIGRDYSSLSSLFSEAEARTIEQYYILVRIERVKELIAYGDLSLSEIAFRTRFSSVAHLSNQFKRVTGMTPSAFKHLTPHKRIPLDKV